MYQDCVPKQKRTSQNSILTISHPRLIYLVIVLVRLKLAESDDVDSICFMLRGDSLTYDAANTFYRDGYVLDSDFCSCHLVLFILFCSLIFFLILLFTSTNTIVFITFYSQIVQHKNHTPIIYFFNFLFLFQNIMIKFMRKF